MWIQWIGSMACFLLPLFAISSTNYFKCSILSFWWHAKDFKSSTSESKSERKANTCCHSASFSTLSCSLAALTTKQPWILFSCSFLSIFYCLLSSSVVEFLVFLMPLLEIKFRWYDTCVVMGVGDDRDAFVVKSWTSWMVKQCHTLPSSDIFFSHNSTKLWMILVIDALRIFVNPCKSLY